MRPGSCLLRSLSLKL